ncbi:MAG: MmgE/PrpD family protein [Allosphingosinicella sp.]|uniref:MmgE/PrpD family protein n=1 Tax=Allosphingosinicella sp. TaxID=2823234 RepID=UPI00392BD363
MPELSLTQRLAHHLERPVAKDNLHRARLHLLDWLGCVAGARRGEVAAAARAAEPDALLRAAMLGNVMEMDDVHRAAILHPGPVVWPAALIAARERGAGMADLLAAGVRGYEAMIAVGATFDAYHYARWHNTATAGGFGAVAAAASILGLTGARLVDALGNAGSVAGGLWRMRHEPVATKQLHVAHVVRTGTWIARLAAHGLTGPSAILEGEQGLYAAMTERPKPLRLGEGWRMDEVSFKPWPACRHAHPAIDAALELKASGALKPPVRVETYADAVAFCDRPEPHSPIEAKFSIQHSVAVAIAHGTPELRHFEDLADAQVAALRGQVDVVESAEFTARYPDHFGAKVSAGGASVELVDTRGDPERPLAPAAIGAKALSLMAWGGITDGARAVHAALSHDGDAAPLVALLEDWL